MDTNTLTEKLERLKLKAELLLSENKKAFVKDIYNTYFFCNIIFVGEKYLTFIPFKGKEEGKKITHYWMDILEVKEYEEVGV